MAVHGDGGLEDDRLVVDCFLSLDLWDCLFTVWFLVLILGMIVDG